MRKSYDDATALTTVAWDVSYLFLCVVTPCTRVLSAACIRSGDLLELDPFKREWSIR